MKRGIIVLVCVCLLTAAFYVGISKWGIEHQTLKTLFETTGITEMRFDFAPTAKNGPTREFFASLLGGEPQSDFELTRAQFEAKCPALYHEVREMRRAEAHG